MYILVLFLFAMASQMILGSHIYFPDEVKMDEDGKGFMVLPGVYFHQPDNKSAPAMLSFGVTQVDDQLSLVMNLTAKMGNNKKFKYEPSVIEDLDTNITGEDYSETFGDTEEKNSKDFMEDIPYKEIGHSGNIHEYLESTGISKDTSMIDIVDESIKPGNNITDEVQSNVFVNAEEKNSKLAQMKLPYEVLEYSDSNNTEIDIGKDKTKSNSVLPFDSDESESNTGNDKNKKIELEIPSMNVKIDTKMENLKTTHPSKVKSIEKLMSLKLDSMKSLPSEDDGKTILFGDEISRPTENRFMFPTTKSPIHNRSMDSSESIVNSPILNPCPEGDIMYKGYCAQILSSYNCPKDQWLVMKGPDFAECVPRPCPFGQISYQDKCVSPDDSTICSKGQMLYVEMTGEAFCDCDPDYIYLVRDGTCVPEYEQGSCDWGKYLVRNEYGVPECVINPCGRDGSVYHEKNKRCYNKNFVGFCEQEQIEIKGNQAECKEILQILALRNVFEVPTLRRCPRGSLRDLLHECRRRYNMPSMPSVLKAKHFHGNCPPGWMKASRGRCKKIIDLFSSPK